MSPFSLLFNLIVTILKKLPIIGTCLSRFSEWYKQASTWDKFVALRRFLVAFHALLFVLLVIKVSGYGSINFIAGISSFGGQYFQMLVNTVNKLFEWGHKLFDFIFPKSEDILQGLLDRSSEQEKVIPIDQPTKEPISITTVVLCLLGLGAVVLVGYTVWEHWTHTPLDKGKGVDMGSASADIQITDNRTLGGRLLDNAKSLGTICYKTYYGAMEIRNRVFYFLNPYVHIKNLIDPPEPAAIPPITGGEIHAAPAAELPQVTIETADGVVVLPKTFNEFIKNQSDSENPLRRTDLFPFTSVNPYDTWYHKLQLKFYGESKADELYRLSFIPKFAHC